MNDIKPPKSVSQSPQGAPAPATDRVVTNVHPRAKTSVGKPIRRWGRIAVILLAVLLFLALVVVGFIYTRRAQNEPQAGREPQETIGPKDNEGKKITNPETLKKIIETQGGETSTMELPR